jgi:hypothetical protein
VGGAIDQSIRVREGPGGKIGASIGPLVFPPRYSPLNLGRILFFPQNILEIFMTETEELAEAVRAVVEIDPHAVGDEAQVYLAEDNATVGLLVRCSGCNRTISLLQLDMKTALELIDDLLDVTAGGTN